MWEAHYETESEVTKVCGKFAYFTKLKTYYLLTKFYATKLISMLIHQILVLPNFCRLQ